MAALGGISARFDPRMSPLRFIFRRWRLALQIGMGDCPGLRIRVYLGRLLAGRLLRTGSLTDWLWHMDGALAGRLSRTAFAGWALVGSRGRTLKDDQLKMKGINLSMYICLVIC